MSKTNINHLTKTLFSREIVRFFLENGHFGRILLENFNFQIAQQPQIWPERSQIFISMSKHND